MAGVIIDIPGVGNIEAKNAATEATLREILKVLQRTQKDIGNLDGGGGGGGGGGVGGADEEKEQQNRIGLGQRLGRGMGFLTGKIKDVGTQFADLTTKSVDLIDDLANVGDSLTSAARSLNNIPVVGGFLSGVLGAVAGAAQQTVGAFQQATASGATFGGSINEFARSASAAGMVMADFAQLIANNGEALRLLGGTSEEGAKRFAQLSKTMKTSPFMTELNNLGFSTKDVNEGMAGYLKYLGQTGKIGNKSNAELAAGSAKYLKEMDLLAKVTGESRKQQEEARQKLLNDAQFQAKVANMGAEAGEAFANTVNGLPPGLRDVAKDIMVTGTATTEEAQKFTALMPKSAALMQKYAAITESGGTITREMQQELQNTMAAEGKAQKENMRTQGMYNKEMSSAYMNTVQAANIQTDALKKGAEAQKNAKATTDGQAAALEGAKRTLAEFSNSFQMALANSGLLTTLMQAFQGLATFVQQIVVPAFQFIAPILGKIVSVAVSLLIPAFQFLGDLVQTYIMPLLPPAIQLISDAFTSIGGFIKDSLIPGFLSVYDFLQDNFVPVLIVAGSGVAAFGAHLIATNAAMIANKAALIAETIGRAAGTAASWLSVASLTALAAATWSAVAPILAVAAPFLIIGGAVAAAAYYFKKMGGDLEVLGNMLGWVGDSFKQVFLKIKEGFFTLLNKIPGMRGDFDDDLKEIAKEQEEMDEKKKQRETEISTRMEANRKAAAAEDAKKAKEREARDKKLANMKFGVEMKGIGAKAAAEKKAIEDKKEAEKAVSIDYSGPEATARSFFQQQKAPEYLKAQKQAEQAKLAGMSEEERQQYLSATAKKASPEAKKEAATANAEAAKKASPEAKKESATAKAEATKKGMEADADAKKAEALKKEEQQKEEKSKEMAPQPTQESAETLLAQLNNNMSELLRITKANNRVAQRQLNVQESLSGDVFANPAA